MLYIIAGVLVVLIGSLITILYYITNVYMPLLQKVNDEVAYLIRDVNGIDEQLGQNRKDRNDIYLKLGKLSNEVTTWKRKK